MCSQTFLALSEKTRTYTAAGIESRPTKVRVVRSSCCEVWWHSWIEFASKASFAQHIDISMVAQFELEGILGRLSSFHFTSSNVHPLQLQSLLHTQRYISDYFVIIIEMCTSYCNTETLLPFQTYVFADFNLHPLFTLTAALYAESQSTQHRER